MLKPIKQPSSRFPYISCKAECRSCNGNEKEALNTELLRNVAPKKEGNVMLDIGAHVGMFSVALNDMLIRSYAIECEDLAYETLCANAELYKQIKPYKFAAHYIDNEKIKMVVASHGRGAGGALKPEIKKIKNTVDGPEVTTARIDTLFLDEIFDIIKIDIEGAEVFALRGMMDTLQRCERACLLCEFCKEAFNNFDVKGEEAFEILGMCGFKPISMSLQKFKEMPEQTLTDILFFKGY